MTDQGKEIRGFAEDRNTAPTATCTRWMRRCIRFKCALITEMSSWRVARVIHRAHRLTQCSRRWASDQCGLARNAYSFACFPQIHSNCITMMLLLMNAWQQISNAVTRSWQLVSINSEFTSMQEEMDDKSKGRMPVWVSFLHGSLQSIYFHQNCARLNPESCQIVLLERETQLPHCTKTDHKVVI